jgi:antitoxin HicB
MAEHVYPAIFAEEANGGYSVRFPDIDGCSIIGPSLYEATLMANDALCLSLYQMEQAGQTIPDASEIGMITVGKSEFLTTIFCDTAHYEKLFEGQKDK